MPPLEKKIKLFKANKIQNRIYLLAGKTNKSVEKIEEEIIKHTGITRNKLSYFQNNTSQPDIASFCLIAQILQCSIDDLIQLN